MQLRTSLELLLGLRLAAEHSEVRSSSTPRGASASGLEILELAQLLEGIEKSNGVGGAAREAKVSYRTAWSRLDAAERMLGTPLVERIKGHGSRLTGDGKTLLAAARKFESLSRRRLRGPVEELSAVVQGLAGGEKGMAPLRVAASDDPLLHACVARMRAPGIQLRVLGSSHALQALADGSADLAAFHTHRRGRLADRLVDVNGEPCFVVALSRREQGLIVARGNPLRVRDVSDLARTGVRFVNRQQGAGTRNWFDELLADEGVSTSSIVGYGVEQQTHASVAAAILAGHADVGFGLRAAAERFGLDFVPFGMETYWIAGARRWRQDARVRKVIAEVRALASSTSGYAPVNRKR